MSDMNKEMRMVLYHTDNNDTAIDVVIQNDSIWATQKSMAELFNCTADNISLHLKNNYAEGELDPEATTEKFSVVRQEGNRNVRRNIDFYNLERCNNLSSTLNHN